MDDSLRDSEDQGNYNQDADYDNADANQCHYVRVFHFVLYVRLESIVGLSEVTDYFVDAFFLIVKQKVHLSLHQTCFRSHFLVKVEVQELMGRLQQVTA